MLYVWVDFILHPKGNAKHFAFVSMVEKQQWLSTIKNNGL